MALNARLCVGMVVPEKLPQVSERRLLQSMREPLITCGGRSTAVIIGGDGGDVETSGVLVIFQVMSEPLIAFGHSIGLRL